MTITYHSEGCFRVQSGDFSLVIDPASERFKASVILRTSMTFENPPAQGLARHTDPHEITGAGEYEISGVRINGFQIAEEKKERSTGSAHSTGSGQASSMQVKTVYVVELEDMRLGFLGQIAKMPDPEILEQFGDVEMLFVPADTRLLPAEVAAKIVKQVEPRMVIPSFSKNPKELLKELGQTAEPVDKLTLKKKDLGAGLKVVWIKE